MKPTCILKYLKYIVFFYHFISMKSQAYLWHHATFIPFFQSMVIVEILSSQERNIAIQ